MKRKAALFLALAAVLGGILMATREIRRRGEAAGEKAVSSRHHVASDEAESDEVRPSKRVRHESSEADVLRDLEREFDKILPARFPQLPSSLCDANLKPGESLVTGGFKNAQGDYEFTSMHVESVGNEGENRAYCVRSTVVTMSRENCGKLGLDPLLSPATMRIQRHVILPPGGASWENAVTIISQPMVVVDADTPATISVSSGELASVMALMVSPGADGRSVRLRTRTESTAGGAGP